MGIEKSQERSKATPLTWMEISISKMGIINRLVSCSRRYALCIYKNVHRLGFCSLCGMVWNIIQNRVRHQKIRSILITIVIAILWSLSPGRHENSHGNAHNIRSSKLVNSPSISPSFQIKDSDMKVFRDPSGYTGVYTKPLRDKERIIHVDLNHMPIKRQYLIMLLREFRKFNATGILLEYGNTFPYHGQLEAIVSNNAYSAADILAIAQACHKYHLKVIVMLPIFGAFDYVLRDTRFQQYRMIGDDYRSLCMCYPSSLTLAKVVIKQILDLHPHTHYIHLGGIGGDDLTSCRYCSTDKTKSVVYASFLNPLLDSLKQYRPSIRIMLWDDALRAWPTSQLNHIANFITPVVGGFYPNIENLIDSSVWRKYSQAFPAIWVAGSYKNVLKCNRDSIIGVDHISNTLSWMRIFANNFHQINFQGAFLFGPAFSTTTNRYCELLPHCAPTIAVLLWTMLSGGYNVDHNRDVSLCVTKCSDFINIEIKSDYAAESCDYHGGHINRLVTQLQVLNLKVNKINKLSGNETMKMKVDKDPLYSALAKDNIQELLSMIKSLKENALIVLSDAYYQADVERWIKQAIQPLYDNVDKLQKQLM